MGLGSAEQLGGLPLGGMVGFAALGIGWPGSGWRESCRSGDGSRGWVWGA